MLKKEKNKTNYTQDSVPLQLVVEFAKQFMFLGLLLELVVLGVLVR